MNIKIIILVALTCYVTASSDYSCSKRSALLLLKRPAYEFSIKLLQKITEDTAAHFVFSPLTTWLQLTALAEGATDQTLEEIWRMTKHHRNRCFRKRLSEILFDLTRATKNESKRKSVMAIDSAMSVKWSFVREVERLYGIKVLLLDFNQYEKSANEINNEIQKGTTGMVDQVVYSDDFNSTMLLICDANYFRSDWKTPFNSGYTTMQPFFSDSGKEIGLVNMMHQKGYFHMLDFPYINAKVLEMPFANPRASMLIFLPRNETWIEEIFYNLQRTRLRAIFNLFKEDGLKLVNVAIPKFDQRTEIDNLPELLYDMGMKRIFDPNLAEFKDMSDYKMYASLMTQISRIEIDERGTVAGAEFLAVNDTSEEFIADRPFAYMVVDKTTEFILYAGVYSIPNGV